MLFAESEKTYDNDHPSLLWMIIGSTLFFLLFVWFAFVFFIVSIRSATVRQILINCSIVSQAELCLSLRSNNIRFKLRCTAFYMRLAITSFFCLPKTMPVLNLKEELKQYIIHSDGWVTLKSEYCVFFICLCGNKWNIFVFWTSDETKEASFLQCFTFCPPVSISFCQLWSNQCNNLIDHLNIIGITWSFMLQSMLAMLHSPLTLPFFHPPSSLSLSLSSPSGSGPLLSLHLPCSLSTVECKAVFNQHWCNSRH